MLLKGTSMNQDDLVNAPRSRMDFRKQVRTIRSREEFILFVWELLGEYKSNPNAWGANDSLELYIQGIASASQDIDGLYLNRDEAFPKQPSWRMLAEILWMATDYE